MRIAVIGLSYVGLPLAAALSEHVETLGHDIDAARIEELKAGHGAARGAPALDAVTRPHAAQR